MSVYADGGVDHKTSVDTQGELAEIAFRESFASAHAIEVAMNPPVELAAEVGPPGASKHLVAAG